ncbi:MAG: hypothetical protein IPO37_17285 [Saprospiraceae bacterium]|nr:hypothetical protein [Saprospiraceae bacterium]
MEFYRKNFGKVLDHLNNVTFDDVYTTALMKVNPRDQVKIQKKKEIYQTKGIVSNPG